METSSTYHPEQTIDVECFIQNRYDFIIIGGGTAGLTIAARLTEDPCVTVGVLEAGKNRLGDPLIDVPGAFMGMLHNQEYDWIFKTTPQANNKNRRHHIPRGKALGGSSAINYMMYVRGSLQDYDDWAILADDPEWGSERMLHYMRKHQTLDRVDGDTACDASISYVEKNHGVTGPVHTSFNDNFLSIESDYRKAFGEVTGILKNPIDAWSGDHIGCFNTLGSVIRTGPDKGKRSYAAKGYFAANAARPNLHVLCEALVTSIELDGQKAVGVSFLHESDTHTINVTREVIVSCGAIQSPQILELSGIGDPEILKAAGVECKIVNKAIGNNFQDHIMTAFSWELSPEINTLEAMYNPKVKQEAEKQLAECQSGPLTSISSTQGFFSYKDFATAEEQASILTAIETSSEKCTDFQKKQYQCILEHLKDDNSANLQTVFIPHRLNEEGYSDQSKIWPYLQPGKPMGITACVCLQYPLSRGSVHIKSADPKEHPDIDPAFLSHPADVAILAAGVKMLDKITNSKALDGKIVKRIFPEDTDTDLSDTKQAEEAVRNWVLSEYHPIGSCAVGDALDSRFRVKGVTGLRVVDASVFPNHVSGNCVASVYAVAEKAADLVKEDYSLLCSRMN